MRECILTLDAGTTGMKCTLFARDGEAIRSAVAPYEVDMPHPGWAEQPVHRFIRAAADGVGRLLARGDAVQVAAIGLSGTMNGCIPTDARGEPLYPNIIHADTRTEAQVARIAAVIDERSYYARTGNRLDMHYTLPKMLWLREARSAVYKNARWYVNTKDALYGWLTGIHGVTDYSDASLTGALRIHDAAWDADLLRALDLDPAAMPEILPSHDVKGRLTRDAALALGLREGTPVAVGAGDGICATHGAGIHKPGAAYINMGSSAWIATLSERPVLDPEMRFFSLLDMDGRATNLCATVQCCGAAFDWAVQNMLTQGDTPSPALFEAMESLARTVPPGAEGVFFLPTFMGERSPWWDPNARGTLIGMSLYHGRGHIARAGYEGVAQALHLGEDAMRQNGLSCDRLTLVGGGTQSGVWPQMLADMLGLPTRVHRHPRQATSLGAAMAAGVGIGMFRDYADAAGMAQYGDAFEPDPAQTLLYQAHFAIYRSLYGHMKEAYGAIAAYQAPGEA